MEAVFYVSFTKILVYVIAEDSVCVGSLKNVRN